MTVIHAVIQTTSKSQRKMDTDLYNALRFTPGTIPPLLPGLNLCNMIPISHTRVYSPHTKTHKTKDEWVFQGVVFYAHPEQEFHPDYANKLSQKRNRWTMHLLERSISTNQTRIVLLEPTFNPQGQVCGLTICLEVGDNATSPMTWAVQHFRADAIPYTPPNAQHSREFYHYELVRFLNHRACQEDYMRVLPADRNGFFLRMVVVFVQIGILDRSIFKPLVHMVEEVVWSNNNSVSQPPELPTTVSPSMLFNRR
ncbi:hypothetical protein B0J17DRAFT_630723 [Rhizoctonia solani]|nr:hypothetical protein B0J17DRAFT_630723 [Rhizoctonia solani]